MISVCKMGSTRLVLCFAITILFEISEADNCNIEKTINNCEFTVVCHEYTSNVLIPPCSYEDNVTLVIAGSNVPLLEKLFFQRTNSDLDRRIRTIVAKGNNWTNVDTNTFSYYRQVTTIDLSNNNVKYIRTQAFENMEYLAALNLSSNIMGSFEQSTFYVGAGKALNIRILDLSYNKLTDLSTELLMLTKLNTLYLQGNMLRTLDSRCFSSLKSLQDLNLGHNELTTLNTSLMNLKNLVKLNLCYNSLKNICTKDIIGLTRLQYMNASNNIITSIQSDCFKNNLNLEVVDFSFNIISTPVQSQTFTFNKKLNYVNFYNNYITVLDDNAFATDAPITFANFEKNKLIGDLTPNKLIGLKNILRFDLANQNITSIKDKAFEVMSKLQYLNLTKNKISEIANSSFINTNIIKLDLSHNQIRTLSFLKDLSSLVEIYINNNYITTVMKLSFFVQSKLKVLDLSMNMIITFEEMSLPLVELQYLNITGNPLTGPISKHVFSPAKSLRSLDLSNFNITKIEAMALENLPSLERLNLSCNIINTIDPKNFIEVRNMQSLDISRNHLKQIAFNSNIFQNLKYLYLNDNDLTNVSFHGEFQLLYLDLSNNNLQSLNSVGSIIFPNITTLRLSNNKIVTFNNRHTDTFTSLVELRLSSNNLSNITLKYFKELITVDLNNNSLTYLNTSFFENVAYIQTLDLSHNNIIDFPPGTFQNMKNLKFLNLSSNYLTQLRYGSLKGLHKAELLDLSKNKIGFLEIDVFHECSHLNTLILDYNFLTTLDVETLNKKYLSNLKTLSIGGNPIACRELVNTMHARDNSVEITALNMVYHEDNVHGIKCGNDTSPGKGNGTTEVVPLYATNVILIILVTLLITSIVLVALVVVIYMKGFRHSNSILINHHNMLGSLEMNAVDLSNRQLL